MEDFVVAELRVSLLPRNCLHSEAEKDGGKRKDISLVWTISDSLNDLG